MKNFVDPEFPPNDDSIFKYLFNNCNLFSSDGNKDLIVHWRRP